MCRSTTSALIAGLLAIAVVSDAAAQDKDKDKDEAGSFDALVASGGKHFQAGAYDQARADWEKAYNINPDPTLLFNIGSTYRREGDLEEALRYYQKYLEVAPADAQYRAVAEEAVLNVKIQIEEREQKKKAEAQKAAPPPARPASRGGVYLRWSGIGLGVLGLASLSFGVFQGLEARDLNDKFENLPEGTEWTQQLQDDFDRGESLETQAVAFSIAGGVAITVGALLYVGGVLAEPDGRAESGPAVSVTPYTTGDQTGVAIAGSF